MTKQDLQKELREKVKEGVKPSHLKKLKRSKSADDIPSPTTSPPLKKSQSQLEISLTQPSPKEQISQLQEQVEFHSETASSYLKSLQTSQAKVSELETKLKNNPPNVLLSEQLKEKQQEVESLREKLETTNSELTALKKEKSNLLDTNLTLKHQGLKD
jgi:chromosome segregation ATPase